MTEWRNRRTFFKRHSEQRKNKVRCKNCGDVIESRHRHDFVTCSCGEVSVDGGMDYFKQSGDPRLIEEIYDDGNGECGDEEAEDDDKAI